jgi:hypothetical protein
VIARARWTLVAAAAAGGVSQLVRRRRPARKPAPPKTAPPPLTTQSSPGQIADLQQAHGADMAAPPASAPGEPTADD